MPVALLFQFAFKDAPLGAPFDRTVFYSDGSHLLCDRMRAQRCRYLQLKEPISALLRISLDLFQLCNSGLSLLLEMQFRQGQAGFQLPIELSLLVGQIPGPQKIGISPGEIMAAHAYSTPSQQQSRHR